MRDRSLLECSLVGRLRPCLDEVWSLVQYAWRFACVQVLEPMSGGGYALCKMTAETEVGQLCPWHYRNSWPVDGLLQDTYVSKRS